MGEGVELCAHTPHIIISSLRLLASIDIDTGAVWTEVKLLWHFCMFISLLICTYVDNRVLELDVESVVRNGDDGFVCTAKIFHPFPLKNCEWHL